MRPSLSRGLTRPRRFRPNTEPLEFRSTPSLVLHVTSLADSNTANSGSLRRAITDANESSPAFDFRVIEIEKAGTYVLTLNGPDEDANATGDLDILQNTSIINLSGGSVVIDAGGLTSHDRVFDIGPNGEDISVFLTNITIQNGQAPAGGGIRVPGPADLTLDNVILRNNKDAGGGGGGLFMLNGDLSLRDSTVSDNIASGSGGGILQSGNGKLSIFTSAIERNQSQATSAGGGGGGVLYAGAGNVSIGNTQFRNNTAAQNGGGFLNTNDAQLTISSSTFAFNRTNNSGGGLFLLTKVASSITNATISDNIATQTGGGLDDNASGGGILTLQNDTIASNTAQTGGGVFAGATSVRLINTIVAQNLAGANGKPDLLAAAPSSFVDVANNFIGDNNGATAFAAGTPNASNSFVGTTAAPLDPLLAPLATNDTQNGLPGLLTRANLPNNGRNGVRDRGRDSGAPSRDERGFTQPSGLHADIGAFEFQFPDMALNAGGPANPPRAGSPLSLTFGVINNDPKISSGNAISVTLPPNTTVVSASVAFTVNANVVTLEVPETPPGALTTLTLTVTPNAPGPFMTTASLGTDPFTSNNTASVNFTVQPAPFPTTGIADVTALVHVNLVGKHKAAKRQTFTLTNTSGTPIQGALEVVAVLPSGVKLKNPSGVTANKQKFLRVNIIGDRILDPGETATFQLSYSRAVLPKRFRVLAGTMA